MWTITVVRKKLRLLRLCRLAAATSSGYSMARNTMIMTSMNGGKKPASEFT